MLSKAVVISSCPLHLPQLIQFWFRQLGGMLTKGFAETDTLSFPGVMKLQVSIHELFHLQNACCKGYLWQTYWT